MSWKRKRRVIGRNTYYSISTKLRQEQKSNDEFEVMLANLSLEEIIALKLELASKPVNGRLYGFPIWKNLTDIVKDAMFRYAYSATRSQLEAMRFLGLREVDFLKYKKRYSIISYFENDKGDATASTGQ
jgi:hypothetical protein